MSISTPSVHPISAPPTICAVVPSQGEDVIMQDPDPIAQMMRDDPEWQKDPDELEEMAQLGLRSCPSTPKSLSRLSPLSSIPPSSPSLAEPSRVQSVGVKPRVDSHPVNMVAGPSSRSDYCPDVESVGGVPLIPGGHGSFRSGTRQKRNSKKR